jgi:hypothetical protein
MWSKINLNILKVFSIVIFVSKKQSNNSKEIVFFNIKLINL